MVWGCGNIFVQDGRDIPIFSELQLNEVMMFIFGKMFGAVIWLLRRLFLCFTRFLEIKRWLWLIYWHYPMVLSIEMLVFLKLLMIGNWIVCCFFFTLPSFAIW